MSCYLPSKVQLCKDAEIKLHIQSEFFYQHQADQIKTATAKYF